MQGELRELDLQSVVLLEFLDTPGDEVAPGSNEIGKDFEYEWFGHDFLLFVAVQGSKFKVQCSSRNVKGSKRSSRSNRWCVVPR
jgi:hypothetical protein